MSVRIGFMQGRLSPLVDGKIQAFPWKHWKDEFRIAHENGFDLMEWTLDQERLHENPLLTPAGRKEIHLLSQTYGLKIQSLTGDNFMQAPFYKTQGRTRLNLLDDLKKILDSCAALDIRLVLIPLVDQGRLESLEQQESLLQGLEQVRSFLENTKMKIIFESDFPPHLLVHLIEQLPSQTFGINYDIGNSAALGFDPQEEIQTYASRIENVHVKDRLLGSTTVPLGTGNANFPLVFELLKKTQYSKNFILQTARAQDQNHVRALCQYRDKVLKWISS